MSEVTPIPEPEHDPYRLLGLTLAGTYRLVEYVGSGGMGAVYRAVVADSGRRVAVKILKPDIVANDRECARLFEQEVAAVRSLEHPNIVRLFDSGADQGYSYMVMEWLDGQTLDEAVAAGQLSIERVDRILKQVCDALAAAHAARVIHLDLKPANIFLLEDGRPHDFVKVIDFGMSRVLTRESGTTMTHFRGTYQYCAPEQFGGRVHSRSDIYSLGATLYHLLTGVVPFGTSYIYAKMRPGRELPALPAIRGVRPDVPPAVERVVKQALSKDPGARQQTVGQLYEEFHRAAGGATTLRFPHSALARLSSRVPASLKKVTSQWLPLSAFALILLSALALIFILGTERAAPGPDAAPVAPSQGTDAQTARDAGPRPEPAQPSGGAARRVTSDSAVAAEATPSRPPAVEPASRPAARMAPAFDLEAVGNVSLSPETTAAGEEFIERGEITVPPGGEAPPALGTESRVTTAGERQEEQRLFALVNRERLRRGLRPLSLDGELSKVAQQHSRNMAQGNFFNHVDRDGKDLKARVRDAGLRNWRSVGENIAYNQGYPDPTEFAVERWMGSENHRQNLLDSQYTHAGVGIVRRDDGTYYFTQVLMKR